MTLAHPASQIPSSLADDPFKGSVYRGIRRLGAGGMGEVFLVEHRELGRHFVAKILHQVLATDPLHVDRMRIEAQSLGRLNHPNIVAVTGFEKTLDGRPFMVMEHLRGKSLAEELKTRGQLPPFEALEFGAQLLSALAAAHAIGVVHRDIKPGNLFVVQGRDGKRILKVLDFGVARVLPDASPQAPRPLMVPTKTGVVIGTPRYVSPEGAQGKHVDQRADLYAAALVIYAMLAGRGPFDHVRGEREVLDAHVLREPEPPSRFIKEPIPAELDRLLMKALRKSPAERFQTATEFKEVLERVAVLARPAGLLETVAFDARAFADSVTPSSEIDHPRPLDTENEERVDPEATQSAPSDAKPEVQIEQPAVIARPETRTVPLIVLFLIVAGLATAIGAAAVAAMRSLAGN